MISLAHELFMSEHYPVTLIEAPHPQEVNYLAGKEAPSSVLINYLWRYNYSEYGKLTQ